jgi:hypothetical protein
MDPAELYHELLEHRWYLSERSQHDLDLDAVVEDYVTTILPKVRDTLSPPADAEEDAGTAQAGGTTATGEGA